VQRPKSVFILGTTEQANGSSLSGLLYQVFMG